MQSTIMIAFAFLIANFALAIPTTPVDWSCEGLGNNGVTAKIWSVKGKQLPNLETFFGTGFGTFTKNSYYYPISGGYFPENATSPEEYVTANYMAVIVGNTADVKTIPLNLTAGATGLQIFSNSKGGPAWPYFNIIEQGPIIMTKFYSMDPTTGVTYPIASYPIGSNLNAKPVYFGASSIVFTYNAGSALAGRSWNGSAWAMVSVNASNYEIAGDASVASASSGQDGFLSCVVDLQSKVHCYKYGGDMALMPVIPGGVAFQTVWANALFMVGNPLVQNKYYLVTGNLATGEWYCYDTVDGGLIWAGPVKLFTTPTSFGLGQLLPQVTFLFGSTPVPQVKYYLFTDRFEGMSYFQNLFEHDRLYDNGLVPSFATSYLSAQTQAQSGTIARNFQYNTQSIVNGTTYVTYDFYASFCFNSHNASSSVLVSGSCNSNQAATTLNAQVVGSSVGVICGFVALIIAYAGFVNL